MDRTRNWLHDLPSRPEDVLPPVADSPRWSDTASRHSANNDVYTSSNALPLPSTRLVFVRRNQGQRWEPWLSWRWRPCKRRNPAASKTAGGLGVEMANIGPAPLPSPITPPRTGGHNRADANAANQGSSSTSDEVVTNTDHPASARPSPNPAPAILPSPRLKTDDGTASSSSTFSYRPQTPLKLWNSLIAGVGLLELANAADFAANVFNENPVPVYAAVLMALGGVVAFAMLYFAAVDSVLSYHNIIGLRAERRYLTAQRRRLVKQVMAEADDEQGGGNAIAVHQLLRTVDCFLNINFRETGTELIDRIGMELLLGLGALCVGIGTYLSIPGDRTQPLLRASNLMTGYIGNTPCAVYGLLNLAWSAWVFARASRHSAAAPRMLRGSRIEQALRLRTFTVQLHSALNGLTGLVAGMAALVTATMWWGYVVLAPCLVTSGLVNLFWRHRLGYDRPYLLCPGQMEGKTLDVNGLVAALRYVDNCRHRVEDLLGATGPGADVVAVLVGNGEERDSSWPELLEFLMRNHLFDELCARILADAHLLAKLFPGIGGPILREAAFNNNDHNVRNTTANANHNNQPANPTNINPHATHTDSEDDNFHVTITMSARTLCQVEDPTLLARLDFLARATIQDAAPRCFIYQERWLLEALGCYLHLLAQSTDRCRADQLVAGRRRNHGGNSGPGGHHRPNFKAKHKVTRALSRDGGRPGVFGIRRWGEAAEGTVGGVRLPGR